jgi:mono/diheme cytochrome c family protein
MRFEKQLVLLLSLAMLLGACGAPHSLPTGPTPIPTLIPATEPAKPLDLAAPQSFNIQSYPALPPSAALGQALYETHCASCHGADGRGAVPGARNFSDLDYMRGETPASFYAAVTEGRGEMPAYRDRLSSDERWNVVFYVWRFSTDAETLALGEQLYQANCVACHGADGSGQVLGAADFTDVRVMAGQAPRDSYLITTQGRGSMPAWQGRLSQDERWAVIDYLLTFSYDPTLSAEAGAASQPTPAAGDATCDPGYLSQSNPFAWDDAEALADGQLIYDEACAICHGTDGTGALPGTSDLGTAETSAALRADGGEYLCIVAEGREGMPGWKETLTVEEMWQVLTYLATFGE